MAEQRVDQAESGAWIGIAGNLVLAVVKFAAGWMSGSKALIADAANSASDVAGSAAVLIGVKAAKKPPDAEHPYGHGKAESISAIIVSILLILAGFEAGISAVQAIWAGETLIPPWYTLAVVIFAIIVKEGLFRYTFRLGKRLNNQALIANAWDHRSDVYSSLTVLVGVGGSMLGGLWNMPWLAYLDPTAGIVVSILVLRTGYRLIVISIQNTMDHVLNDEDASEIREAVEHVKGVIAVDSLRARENGRFLIVDVKISVNPSITVQEGHTIAKSVKRILMLRFPRIVDVFVHVNPYESEYPYKTPSQPGQEDQPTLLH